MHLKSLEISGFKSFAKKTTLKFNRGITAIVGPNGSGKSNIADALRWVMGEQSIKTLRGKKSEDVIFSGSDKKSKLGLAEVSLELDNSDKQVPIEYSELVITRRIYRDGESQYLINQHRSRLTDVNLLLTKANFGHRTYSVIGQGMIDNFLISTPQERKVFFEEATGVKQYQIKKQIALKKLEHVWQNLTTLKVKLSEMEPHLRLLTRQVKKLHKRKELENQLLTYKTDYYLSLWHEIDQLYQQQQQIINNLTSHKSSLEKKYHQLQQQLVQLTKDNKTNQTRAQLRQIEKELIEEKIKLKEDLLTLQVKQPTTNFQDKQNNLIIPQESLQKIEQLLQNINNLYQNNNQADKSLKNLEQKLQQIKQLTISILAILKPFTKQINLNKTSSSHSKHDDNNLVKINSLKKQLEDIEKKLNQIQSKIEDSEKQDEQNKTDLWDIQTKFSHSQNELNKINQQINEARINLTRTETRRFDLQQEIKYELPNFNELKKPPAKILTSIEKNQLQEQIKKIKNHLEIIGGLDPDIEAEYQQLQQNYDYIKNQAEDLEKTIHSLKKLIHELDAIIKNKIKSSYEEINKYFKKYFKILFNGGRAELLLIKESFDKKQTTSNDGEDSNENLSASNQIDNFFQLKNQSTFSGIEINATPPGKRLKSIQSLSGGERALTSIALICAIISSNPAPFVVLDEVDAALDESNTIRFASILKELSHKTQFIVITHNRSTMEQANLLYGVTMGDDGVSKLLSIKLDEVKKYEN